MTLCTNMLVMKRSKVSLKRSTVCFIWQACMFTPLKDEMAFFVVARTLFLDEQSHPSTVWTWFSKVRWHTGWSWSATFNKELHFNHSCKNWCQFLDVKLWKFYTPHSKITNYSLVHTWFQVFKCLLLKKWNADFKSSFSVWNDTILYQLLHLCHSKLFYRAMLSLKNWK